MDQRDVLALTHLLPYCSYCHVYQEGELPALVESVPTLELEETFYDASNWCVIARRR